MTDPALPSVIEALRTAINRGDTDGFLALFPEHGVVEDWGRRFAGPAAIRGWSDKELIGARGTLTFARAFGHPAAGRGDGRVEEQLLFRAREVCVRARGWASAGDANFGELMAPRGWGDPWTPAFAGEEGLGGGGRFEWRLSCGEMPA